MNKYEHVQEAYNKYININVLISNLDYIVFINPSRATFINYGGVPRSPLSSYGASDLDPLSGLHHPDGGMLFDPLRIRNSRPFNPMYNIIF